MASQLKMLDNDLKISFNGESSMKQIHSIDWKFEFTKPSPRKKKHNNQISIKLSKAQFFSDQKNEKY